MDRFSTKLHRFFFEEESPEEVTLGDLLHLAEDRAFGFLLIALALPCLLPVLRLGFAVPMGVMIACLATQMMAGIHVPWLPNRLLNHPVKIKLAQRIAGVGITWLKRLERFSKSRLSMVCTNGLGRLLIGLILFISAIAMILPVPGTGPIALGVVFIGVGLLEDDGVTSLVGMSICIAASTVAVAIFCTVGWGGFSLIKFLFR